MLETFGVNTYIDGIPYHGKTDIAILRAAVQRCGISDRIFDERVQDAIGVVCREVAAHSTEIVAEACLGIPELVATLHTSDRLVGTASGNLEAVGWRKVAAAGLRSFFDMGSFGDKFERRTQIFEQAKTMARARCGSRATICFFGDTPDDIHAARAIDAQIVAVATGTYALEVLARESPDACLKSCADLSCADLSGAIFSPRPKR